MVTKAPAAPAIPFLNPFSGPAYNWTGFYFGGHLGAAWGTSNGTSGSINLYQTINTFDEGGSWFEGLQGGYNHMLPNRVVIGTEVDATFPSFQTLPSGVNPFGVSTGGVSSFTSPTLGAVSFAETMLASGTVRGRIGYAPGHWLFYATGGFAWTYNQQSLTQVATGNTETPFLWRLGWAAGAGVEAPIAPHWTAKLEYLFTDYGNKTYGYSGGLQPITSNWQLNEVRFGLNYQFNNDSPVGGGVFLTKVPATPDPDNLSLHGQTTFVWQGYPAFRSPYMGAQSLPGASNGRETIDANLFVGLRLWQGAELWIDPEIDQGHGLAETHGVAGFPSGEAYKQGFTDPYARANRYFIRQTIDLGGATQKVDEDVNVFAGSQTANRLVLTVGKFYMIDIFDTNKYANNSKSDFLNWSVINAGTFDFGSDAWSTTYGAVAEWYQGNWTLRSGIFDMSETPADGVANSQYGYELDSTFDQFEFVEELENRYQLWGEPGKIKVTGFLIRGRMANFQDALNLSAATGLNINNATFAARVYQSRPGVSLNLEQQVNETTGVFARAGWADGSVESWDNTDIDRTVEAGVSINGKLWNRPDDTVGIAGVINGIAPVHEAWLNAGGLGIVVGDGQLPKPGLEQLIETYYSYSVNTWVKLSADYQFVANPGYNTQRGPVNIFAGRLHAAF